MKRITAILLSLLFLCIIASCSNAGITTYGEINLDKATIKIGDTHTDFDGINIRIISAVWNDEAIKIDLEWINKTKYETSIPNTSPIIIPPGCFQAGLIVA